MAKTKPMSFDAVLERKPERLGWTIVRVPASVSKAWGRGAVKVRGEINGLEFRTSLFPDGQGNHSLLVNKQMQRGTGVVAGHRARFHLERDERERVVKVPAELNKALSPSKRLEKLYSSLNYSMRK